MCGICGIVDYSSGANVKEETIRRMCGALKHRGPDDEGVFVGQGSPSVGLGHRRLSIIDLSRAGHQPMSNEEGTLWMTFNGEIYNYKELREDLQKKGHRFKSQTDSETVIHLYEEYNLDCVKFLRGMFAFALWDKREGALILARDRVGQKPMVYSYVGGRFCFASELLALLKSDLVKKEINYQAINYYLTFGYIPAPETIYSNVHKLPPAHLLVLKEGKIAQKRYWQLDYSHKVRICEEEASEEILRLLREAAKIRLYSDVPLGAFLSGGIDSSSIVAMMSQISGRKIKTFSIGFEEKDYSELRFAKNIAREFDCQHFEFIVKPKALEILPLLVERYGEPYADSSCIPTYYVSQETRRFVTVALNGDGGDESFAGYERYQAMLIAEMYQKAPRVFKELLSKSAKILPDSINAKNSLRRARRFLEAVDLPKENRYLRWVGIFDNQSKKNICRDAFLNRQSDPGCAKFMELFFSQSKNLSLLDRLLQADVNTYLPYDLLVKVDITSMANSLEARSPFLDHRLMEFAASLPTGYKMNRLVKKYILKKTVSRIIPRENIYRKKMGFGVPVGAWLRGELKGLLYENLLSKKSLERGYFKPEAIKEMVNLHVSRKKDYSYQLWALLMLELWHERFVE